MIAGFKGTSREAQQGWFQRFPASWKLRECLSHHTSSCSLPTFFIITGVSSWDLDFFSLSGIHGVARGLVEYSPVGVRMYIASPCRRIGDCLLSHHPLLGRSAENGATSMTAPSTFDARGLALLTHPVYILVYILPGFQTVKELSCHLSLSTPQ